MTPRIPSRLSVRVPAVAGAALLSGVLLAACGSDSSSPADPVETDHPEARLVVAFPDQVKVLSAEDGSEIASFGVDSAPYVQPAADGRHVFTLEHQDKRVRIVDAGTWTDGGSSYVAEPSRLGTVIEGTAYHAVSDGTRSAVWNDDTGSFEVFEAADFGNGDVTPTVIERDDPHHGVAAPVPGGYLVSFSVDESPVGVARLDEEGTEVERYEGCEGLHGETHLGDDGYGFGCKDGIMVVDPSGARKVDSPVEGAGTGSLIGDHVSPVLAGTLSAGEDGDPGLAESLALYDTAAGTAKRVDLGVQFSNLAAVEGHAVVLGTDGDLRVVDLATGDVRTITATEPWEKPEEWTEPRPQVSTSGDTAWVSDPMTGKIIAVDLASGETVSTIDVEGTPGQLLAVNADDGHEH